jgi:serine protease DegQ
MLNPHSGLNAHGGQTAHGGVNPLGGFSQSIAQIAAGAVHVLCAIRIGPNRHITGLVCEGDIIVTTDQELPALESYTVVLAHGHLAAARPGPRDAGSNLAMLRLEVPFPVANLDMASASVGNLVVVIGADGDASPTVRLSVIHKFLRTADGPAPVLDLPVASLDPGSIVLDAEGRLIGLAALNPSGDAVVIPGTTIGRMMVPTLSPAVAQPAPPAPAANRRGWLGVALQPITVPEAIVARAGQTSGRMVMSTTKGGPAELAGLRVGDVLLALNGTSASGPHALRAFLDSERIGSMVEVRLLRDGTVMTAQLTVAAQPG